MSGNSTLARPYAKAAFEHAKAKGELHHWSDMLARAVAIEADPLVKSSYGHPAMKPGDWAELFLEVGGSDFSEDFSNFMQLIAKNGRIPLLADVNNLFEQLRAEEEKTIEVKVVSAVPLTDEYREKLQQALKQRFEKTVELECHVDESIIGGVVIHAGDFLIDASLRGKLDRMTAVLTE